MSAVACSNCGAKARVRRGTYRFAESGLRDLVIQGIKLIQCSKCGNEDPIIPAVNDLMRAIALGVIQKPYRLEGAEVRFLRKHLGMTQDEFSKLLHVDKATLSKWENDDDPVGEQSDLLIRVTALALGKDLAEKAEETVRGFENIKQSRRHVRIEVDSRTLQHEYV